MLTTITGNSSITSSITIASTSTITITLTLTSTNTSTSATPLTSRTGVPPCGRWTRSWSS